MTNSSHPASATTANVQRWKSASSTLMLSLIALFFFVGFLHLRADFPNHSPWNDWAKMTDEGWYGGGAIHHFLLGRWYLPDSFNPTVAMPVWPAMLTGWFALTGVGMVSARVLTMLLYGMSLFLLYLVVHRDGSATLAMLAVLLTVVNPFCYAFDRLALLEPVSVFWFMLTLLIAGGTRRENILRQVLLGALIFLLLLTKVTNLSLVPAILYLLWAAWGWPPLFRLRSRSLHALGAVVGTALILWTAYVGFVLHTTYSVDYRFLFAINAYRVHLSIVPKMAWFTLRHGEWVNPILFWVAMAISLISVFWLRELWRMPLFGTALIAIIGQLAYIGYHTNFQPRYYLLTAMPLTLIIVLGLAAIHDRCDQLRSGRRSQWAVATLAVVVLAVMLRMGAQTVEYVLHPEYSFWNASQHIGEIIHKSGASDPILLSDSGDDITLWTNIPSVSESFTPHGLDTMLRRYNPGWYAAWAGWENIPIHQIGERYHLHEVARFNVFDDPARQTLILYSMIPRK